MTNKNEILEQRTRKLSEASLSNLLQEISYDWGLSWELTAKLLGTTSARIRKWRREDNIPLQQKHELAALIAFCEAISKKGMQKDSVALWLESAVTIESSLTFADLYAEGLLLDFIGITNNKAEATLLLDRELPGWRERFPSDHNHLVVQASDDQPSIIPRGL